MLPAWNRIIERAHSRKYLDDGEMSGRDFGKGERPWDGGGNAERKTVFDLGLFQEAHDDVRPLRLGKRKSAADLPRRRVVGAGHDVLLPDTTDDATGAALSVLGDTMSNANIIGKAKRSQKTRRKTIGK